MQINKNYVILVQKDYVRMKSKLTLNIDKAISEKAKVFARQEGRSLSDLVEDLLKFLVQDIEPSEMIISPRIQELAGSVKLDPNMDYEEEYHEWLFNKYLHNDKSIS